MTVIVAGTGHRPDKIGGYNPHNPVRASVFLETESILMKLKPNYVITGMALGFDQLLAEVCIGLGIPFVAAVPFEGQESVWPTPAQDKYKQLLAKANSVFVVSPGPYSSEKMQLRNQWMVNEATHVVACWDKSHGGTGKCVKYAMSVNKPIHFITEFVKIRDGVNVQNDYAFQKTLKLKTDGYVSSPTPNWKGTYTPKDSAQVAASVGKVPIANFLKGLKDKTDLEQKAKMESLEYTNALKAAVNKKSKIDPSFTSEMKTEKYEKYKNPTYEGAGNALLNTHIALTGSVADFLYGGQLNALKEAIQKESNSKSLDLDDIRMVDVFTRFLGLWKHFEKAAHESKPKVIHEFFHFTVETLKTIAAEEDIVLEVAIINAAETLNLAPLLPLSKKEHGVGHKKSNEDDLPPQSLQKAGRKMNLD